MTRFLSLRAVGRGALAVALGLSLAADAAVADTPPRADTRQGPVEGLRIKGVSEFLGIPYAAAPVGELRWRPPVPTQPWKGVLRATQFGPACAQVTTLGVFAGPPTANEDCLTLNVFTPKMGWSVKLPVIFWIHGGGNMDGWSGDYDASRLAVFGQTVVVSVNYRLGLLGWLANPALDAEGHPFGNYGLLDQLAALQWVRDNIASFGGDAGNVTVAGESAGSIDTQALVVSPLAAGLFHRGIFESVVRDGVPLARAETLGADFAQAAGCGRGAGTDVAACLRRLPAERILQLAGKESGEGPFLSIIISDGQTVPASGLFAAFKAGRFTHMPIMSGTTRDEENFEAAIMEYFSGPPRHAMTEEEFVVAIMRFHPGDAAGKVLDQFNLADYATPQRAWDAAATGALVCPQLALNRVLASQTTVYAYEFNDPTAPFYFPVMPGFESLAYHTSDLQYLFPLWHGGSKGEAHPLNAEQQHLSEAMIKAWAHFARHGDPNGPGAPEWPVFKPTADKPGLYLLETLPVSRTITDQQFSTDHKCDFWANLVGH